MPKGSLKNRLGEPIPEKCPLSEALVWLINGCLPISLDDQKTINNRNLIYVGVDPRDYIPEGFEGPDHDYEAFDSSGARVPIEYEEINSAKDCLLLALKKGQIKSWGNLVEFNVDDATETNKPNFTATKNWEEYHKNNYELWELDSYKEIPSKLWFWELIEWTDSILHHPVRSEDLSQFSDVVVSTKDLFKKFATENLDEEIQSPERFLIPISEAVSLMTTGEHNSDNSAIYDLLHQKASELIRALRNDKLYAEGLHPDGEIKMVPAIYWNSNSDIMQDKTEFFSHIVVDEHEITTQFNIPQLETIMPEPTKEILKQGRPPIVERELWLEELAILFKAGKIEKGDKTEAIAQSLIDVLNDKHNKHISIDTVRKDWLRPLFKEAKKRNGGK